jgi:hypothetical protein
MQYEHSVDIRWYTVKISLKFKKECGIFSNLKSFLFSSDYLQILNAQQKIIPHQALGRFGMPPC